MDDLPDHIKQWLTKGDRIRIWCNVERGSWGYEIKRRLGDKVYAASKEVPEALREIDKVTIESKITQDLVKMLEQKIGETHGLHDLQGM